MFFVWEKNKKQGIPKIDKNIQKTSITTPVSIKATTTPESTRSTSTSVALGWATYTNEKFGFSIDYPKNFVYKESGADVYPQFVLQFGNKGMVDSKGGIISVYVATIYKSFDDYFKDEQDQYKIDGRGRIDNNEAVFYTSSLKSNAGYYKAVAIKRGNTFYTIATFSFNNDYRKITNDFAPGVEDLFLSESDYDKVISSFKFLK
jgi:hypothetical protein